MGGARFVATAGALAGLLAGAPGGASARTPLFTATVAAANGSSPQIALDNHGQAQVSWTEGAGSTNLLHACQLPPGALTCAHDTVAAQPGRNSAPVLPNPADGQQVDIVVGDFPSYSGAAGAIASGDGGASYGTAYPLGKSDPLIGGLVFPHVIVMGPGQIAFSGLDGNVFEAAPLDGSATPTAVALAPNSQTDGVREMGIGFLDATTPLLVWNHDHANPDGTSQQTIGYRRWLGTHSINDTSTWAPWSGPGSLNDAATWGQFKDFSPPDGMTPVGDYQAGRIATGPSGVFAIYFPKVAQPGAGCGPVPEIIRYDPSLDSWGAPVPVDANPHTDLATCSYGDGFTSANPLRITEDAAGVLHVIYSFSNGHPPADDSPPQGLLYTVSTDGGRTFAPPVSIAGPDESLDETRLAVDASGDASLVFSQSGGVIKVRTLPPLSAFYAPVTTITSGPAEGSTVYPCRSCAEGPGPQFTFTSSVAGAHFDCRTFTTRDAGGIAEACSSPYRPDIAPGQDFTFTVSAISPTGIYDRTPPQRHFRYTSQRAEYALRASAAIEKFACQNDFRSADGEDGALAVEALLWRVRAYGAEDHCPGQTGSTQHIASQLLRALKPGRVGTTLDLKPLCDVEGEYDTVLKSLVPIAYRYSDLLDPDVRRHLLGDLLNQTGEAGDGIFHGCADQPLRSAAIIAFGPAVLHLLSHLLPAGAVINLLHPALLARLIHNALTVPETENHVLLIESARYLTNQLRFETTHRRRYDNRANGMTAWVLRHLRQFAQHDFLEYNARPYQRYAIDALLNLYDLSRDARVRTAAQVILDYTTTKFALSSNELRRVGPFRRRNDGAQLDADHEDLYAGNGDPQTAFFELYAGPPAYDQASGTHDVGITEPVAATSAALSSYLPPEDAITLATVKSVPYTETFVHGARPELPRGDRADGGVEIYASSPSFLLTAGGVWLNSGYSHDEITGPANIGNKVSTTLMPTGANVEYRDLIRFDGFGPEIRDGNLCVARGFACGVHLNGTDFWKRCLPPSAVRETPHWLFLDLNNNLGPVGCRSLGFYVAIHWLDGGHAGRYGYLSAVESSSMSFDAFFAKTQTPPGNRQLDYRGLNTFRSADGHTYKFFILQPGDKYDQMVRSVDGVHQPDAHGGLATGPYLTSSDHSGYLEIRSPGCSDPLILDYRAALNPVRRTGSSCHEWPTP